MPLLPASETRVSKPVSTPSPIASTPASTATPSPRRTHSPTPNERFISANTRPPTASANASEVAAPAAYTSNSSVVVALAPCNAAPVSNNPRIGPAHGAHSKPVATPRPAAAHAEPAPCVERCDNRLPSATNGRASHLASRVESRLKPSTASTTSATARPAWFACTAQPPPTAASVATSAKVTAMPASIGRPLRRNGRSARANTNGSTGRMQGLRMVRAPPR